jgi:hypothetical protein
MVVPTIIHPLKEAAGTIEGYCMQEPPAEKSDNEKQNRIIDGIGGGAGALVGCCVGIVLNWVWRR